MSPSHRWAFDAANARAVCTRCFVRVVPVLELQRLTDTRTRLRGVLQVVGSQAPGVPPCRPTKTGADHG